MISRRLFLAASASMPVMSRGSSRTVFAYVGSYTDASRPPGDGTGITLLSLDGAGVLHPLSVFANPSPSWLAVSPSRTHLYATNEVTTYGTGADGTGSVTAFGIDRATGALGQLNTVSSHGTSPPHASVHPSGRFVFVANYGSGSVAVLPVRTDGSLGEAVDVHQDQGPPGDHRPSEGPPGNFSISDHDGPHAHMIAADPTGRFVIANDLGLDRTYLWTFDGASGKLTPRDPPFVQAASAGAGPRHFAFHPNGRIFYNLYEEASELVVYSWDAPTGALALRQKLSTVPRYAGTNFTSELVVAPDARFLYVGNRLHNTIGIFGLDHNGRARWLGEEWTRGDYPRNFALDPTGNVMVVCNQRSDQITVFRVNRLTGALRFTGQYVPIGSPSMVAFPG